MDADRINKTEQEIQRILPARAEYVVTTSEYAGVRERLISRDAKRKTKDANRPALRRRLGDGKVDDADADSSDDRPTLKKHDLE